jgi:hypothetical protein
MQIDIKGIETDEFRNALTKALAGSVVGDVVMHMLQNAASDYRVRQSIETVVRDHMTQHARSLIAANVEFQMLLRGKVEELLTESLLDELVSRVRVDKY